MIHSFPYSLRFENEWIIYSNRVLFYSNCYLMQQMDEINTIIPNYSLHK
jgi:hypothetical protein